MSESRFNKYRAAVEILQRGREVLVEGLADEILEHSDELVEGGFTFNEFLESQGTRIHFLCLLVAHLEQSADALDEVMSPAPPRMPKKRRSRSKKLERRTAPENPAGDA